MGWFEKSHKNFELMGKISSGDINSNISLEEKEKVLRELQMKYENNQETLRTIAAQNKNLENQLNDKKYDDLETKLSKQQMLSFELDEREERFAMRQRFNKSS